MSEAASENEKKPLEKFLSIFSDVRGGEGQTTVLLLFGLFVVLFAYYVLKTVREPLVLASAARDLAILAESDLPAWLKGVLELQDGPQLKAAAAAGQALLLLVFVPAYGWLASRVNRVTLIVSVTAFFIVNIELFYLASKIGVPFLGFYFYIWVGIFSVAIIAQFWSYANDLYDKDAGDRLFPLIAIGATAGSPLGSYLAKYLFELKISSFLLMQLAAALLGVYLVITLLVNRREGERQKEQTQISEQKLAKGGGFALLFKNPYLLLVALVIALLNLVNTSGEFILSGYVVEAAREAAGSDPAAVEAYIGSFYGGFFSGVNVVAFILQTFVVSRIVKLFGLRGVILILPVVALASYSLIAFGVGLTVLRWAKTAENATDYSIMNTGKAMFWLPTTREEKYKAKQAVDTFFVRIGDVVAAVMFIVATTMIGWSVRQLAGVVVALVLVWLAATFMLLRQHGKLAASAPTSE